MKIFYSIQLKTKIKNIQMRENLRSMEERQIYDEFFSGKLECTLGNQFSFGEAWMYISHG